MRALSSYFFITLREPDLEQDLFVPFLESTSNFKHFETKDDSHSYFISDITDCERVF